MDRIIQWNKSFVIHRNSTFNIFLQDFLLLLLLLCDGKEIYLLSVQNCPEKPFLIYDATPSWWWWSLLLIKIEIDFFHFFIHFTVINWQVFFRFFLVLFLVLYRQTQFCLSMKFNVIIQYSSIRWMNKIHNLCQYK